MSPLAQAGTLAALGCHSDWPQKALVSKSKVACTKLQNTCQRIAHVFLLQARASATICASNSYRHVYASHIHIHIHIIYI